MNIKFAVGIVLAVLLVGGVVYWHGRTLTPPPEIASTVASTTTTGSDGWKTYTNYEYGFSVSFPSTFSVHQDHAPAPYFDIDNQNGTPYLGVVITTYGPDQKADKGHFFVGPYPRKETTHSVLERILNGMKGVEQYGEVAEGTEFEDEFMYLKNSSLWEIYLNPSFEGRKVPTGALQDPVRANPPYNLPLEKNIYNRILASFRILN